jgi:hypothetical protein
MNIETSESGPKLNLLKPDGTRNQTGSSDVIAVLLDGEGWTAILPGSFHFYKTAGDKPVPFVQFDVIGNPANSGVFGKYRIEVFPTAIAGLAYPVDDDE